MANVKQAKAHVAAKNNIAKTWKVLLNKAEVLDRNQPLTDEILMDPTHSVVIVINWCYSNEGFTYRVLNHSCRVKDSSKISTLGPFAMALSQIIWHASQYRTDVNPWDFAKCPLFRGSGLTPPEIEDYRNLAKVKGKMRLFGYTSTSRTRSAAE